MLRCARLLADRTGLCFYDGFGSSRAHPCFCFQLNRLVGRRGTIFITALFSFLTCIWQGVTNSWPHLFVARFVLGLGIGPKSSTVPVYAAECQSSFICRNCWFVSIIFCIRRCTSTYSRCFGDDVVSFTECSFATLSGTDKHSEGKHGRPLAL